MPIPEFTPIEKIVAALAALWTAMTGWSKFRDFQRQRSFDKETEQRKAELQDIRDQARDLLASYREERNKATEEIARHEAKIEDLTNELIMTKSQLAKKEAEIITLKARVKALEDQL